MDDKKPVALSDEQLAELNKRVAAAKPEDRQAEAIKYFAELEGAKIQEKKSPELSINVTDEQLQRILSGNVNAKEVAKDFTDALKEVRGVPHAEAKAAATNVLSERISKIEMKRKENKLSAECFRALFMMKKGTGSFTAVEDAYKREAEYLGRETPFLAQSKEERAMSVGTDTAGGFFAPEIFSTQLFERLEKYGMARRFANMIPMESEILHFPKLTVDVTAAVTAEAGTITASDITSAQLTLQPQKLAVMAGPFSDELLLHADPGIVEILNNSSARALAKLEDNNVFIGSSGTFTGLLENATGNVTTIGGTAVTDITFDDIIDLQDSIEERYATPGVSFWWNKAVTRELRKQKGADQFFWGDMASSRLRTLLGDEYHHIVDMVAAPGSSTKFGVYVDLDLVWVGTRGGLRIDMLTEGTVNGVNLGETASMALRVLEYWDNEVIDDDGVALIQTSA